MASFDEFASMVNNYYDEISTNPSADAITRASDTASSDCGVNNTINQVSNMTVNKSMNGSIRGYSFTTTFKNPKGGGDSNPSNFDSTTYRSFGKATGGGGSTRGGGAGRYRGSYYSNNRGSGSTNIPATKTSNGFVSGLKDAGGNIVKAVNTVVSGAWAGVSAMAKFGFDISKDLYNGARTATADIWNSLFQNNKRNNPDYFTLYNEDEHGRTYIHAPVVFDDDGKATLYLPDDVLADIYRMCRGEGMVSPSTSGTATRNGRQVSYVTSGSFDGPYWEYIGIPGYCFLDRNGSFVCISRTNTPVTVTQREKSTGRMSTTTMGYNSRQLTDAGTPYYVGQLGGRPTSSTNAPRSAYDIGVSATTILDGTRRDDQAYRGVQPAPDTTPFLPSVITGNDIPTIIQQMNDNYAPQMGSPIVGTYMDDSCNEININYHPTTFPINVGVGDIFPIGGGNSLFGGINVDFNQQSNPGIGSGFDIIGTLLDLLSQLASFELPDISDILSNLIDAKDLLQWLLDVLAELFQGAPGGSGISLDPNINVTINNYYENYNPEPTPTPTPTPEPPALPPINVNPPQVVVQVNPDYPEIQVSPVIDFKPNITNPNPTISVVIPPWPTESDEPEITPSSGWPTSMWNVYNPTQGQVNSFGAWLWHPDFVDTIKRLFESPIDAVFTLHKVFVIPHTGGSAPIVVGSIASNVSSAVVDVQYTNLDCGEIDLDEFFGNIFDYAPYTILQLYLPFIGIVELDPAYCMRSTISIYYTVDVFTGACVAKVGCKRDGYDVCVYEFTGSCSVEYPVSYHSYSSIVSSILSGAISATAGAIGTYVSGNPMPAVYGVSNAIHQGLSGRSETRHSGSFAGAHGAMGIRKPYLIISRPILELADNFPYFDGYPANQTVMVGSCSGYIKCKECHLNVPNAYKSELDELDTIFKSGVLIY